MEENEVVKPPTSESQNASVVTMPSPGGKEGGCAACGGSSVPLSYVYALGRIEPRFPRPSVEKEFAQATGRAETSGKTDHEAFHAVLAKRENRYLARQLCWLLTVQGMETYLLQPRDPSDFDLLVEAVRPAPSPMDIDAVTGLKGPIAPPELCNGLMIPIVAFDQIYSFGRDVLIKSIPKPERCLPRNSGRRPRSCSTGSCR